MTKLCTLHFRMHLWTMFTEHRCDCDEALSFLRSLSHTRQTRLWPMLRAWAIAVCRSARRWQVKESNSPSQYPQNAKLAIASRAF